ncbi:MAG: putative ADP-ribose pyrophosphatase [Chloroflexi bacterium OLB15]|nr:MAG: putative ADP-ribose pyrophosphatase [Chloroflexi bacterium OLB15]
MKRLVYCPVCGHELGEREEGGRIRQACSNCGYVHYVNPVPAVGILIEMDGGIVLIRRNNPPHQGRWALPSGYIESDESAEDAAVREAFEETGLRVELLELAGVNSFPEGPPISGLMVFYRAKPIDGELRGGDDASEAKVFQPEELPLLPFRTHREAISQWLERSQSPHKVPAAPEDEQPDFFIRPVESSDANELMALLALISANRELERESWREVFQRLRETDSLEVFVAVAKQQPPLIIGFVALSIVRALTEGRGLINDMAVLPTYQRRGVGAALLEAAMRRAERLNLHLLMINEQRANDRARAFYSALGFDEEAYMQLKLKS